MILVTDKPKINNFGSTQNFLPEQSVVAGGFLTIATRRIMIKIMQMYIIIKTKDSLYLEDIASHVNSISHLNKQCGDSCA